VRTRITAAISVALIFVGTLLCIHQEPVLEVVAPDVPLDRAFIVDLAPGRFRLEWLMATHSKGPYFADFGEVVVRKVGGGNLEVQPVTQHISRIIDDQTMFIGQFEFSALSAGRYEIFAETGSSDAGWRDGVLVLSTSSSSAPLVPFGLALIAGGATLACLAWWVEWRSRARSA
jgi:hypothetical protein